MRCYMADDIYPAKKRLSKLRRKRSKKFTEEELAEIFASDEDSHNQADRMFRF